MTDIILADEAATLRLGHLLAQQLQADDVVLLDGVLGAGKTTLTRGLVGALGGDLTAVASPTYTLMHVYDARITILHIDAYRLADAIALRALGFDELAERAIVVIEWAERVATAFDKKACWHVVLEHQSQGGRCATITAPHGKPLQGSLGVGMLA